MSQSVSTASPLWPADPPRKPTGFSVLVSTEVGTGPGARTVHFVKGQGGLHVPHELLHAPVWADQGTATATATATAKPRTRRSSVERSSAGTRVTGAEHSRRVAGRPVPRARSVEATPTSGRYASPDQTHALPLPHMHVHAFAARSASPAASTYDPSTLQPALPPPTPAAQPAVVAVGASGGAIRVHSRLELPRPGGSASSTPARLLKSGSTFGGSTGGAAIGAATLDSAYVGSTPFSVGNDGSALRSFISAETDLNTLLYFSAPVPVAPGLQRKAAWLERAFDQLGLEASSTPMPAPPQPHPYPNALELKPAPSFPPVIDTAFEASDHVKSVVPHSASSSSSDLAVAGAGAGGGAGAGTDGGAGSGEGMDGRASAPSHTGPGIGSVYKYHSPTPILSHAEQFPSVPNPAPLRPSALAQERLHTSAHSEALASASAPDSYPGMVSPSADDGPYHHYTLEREHPSEVPTAAPTSEQQYKQAQELHAPPPTAAPAAGSLLESPAPSSTAAAATGESSYLLRHRQKAALQSAAATGVWPVQAPAQAGGQALAQALASKHAAGAKPSRGRSPEVSRSVKPLVPSRTATSGGGAGAGLGAGAGASAGGTIPDVLSPRKHVFELSTACLCQSCAVLPAFLEAVLTANDTIADSLGVVMDTRRVFDETAAAALAHSSSGSSQWQAASLDLACTRTLARDTAADTGSRARKLSQSTLAIHVSQATDSLKACASDVTAVSQWQWKQLPPSDEELLREKQRRLDSQMEASRLTDELAEVRSELEQTKFTVSQLQSSLAAQQATTVSAQREGKEAGVRAVIEREWVSTKLAQAHAQTQARLAAAEATIKSLRDDKARVEAKASRMDVWLKEMRDQVVQSQAETDAVRKQAQAQVNKVVAGQSSVAQETALFQSHIAMLEAKLAVKREKHQQLRRSSAEELAAVHVVLEGVRVDLSVSAQAKDACLHSIQELQGELGELRCKLGEAGVRHEAVTAQLAISDMSVQELRTDVIGLKKQIAAGASELQQCRSQCERVREELSCTRAHLATRSAELGAAVALADAHTQQLQQATKDRTASELQLTSSRELCSRAESELAIARALLAAKTTEQVAVAGKLAALEKVVADTPPPPPPPPPPQHTIVQPNVFVHPSPFPYYLTSTTSTPGGMGGYDGGYLRSPSLPLDVLSRLPTPSRPAPSLPSSYASILLDEDLHTPAPTHARMHVGALADRRTGPEDAPLPDVTAVTLNSLKRS